MVKVILFIVVMVLFLSVSVYAAQEYLVPGNGVVNETGSRQFLVPGYGVVGESQSAVAARRRIIIIN